MSKDWTGNKTSARCALGINSQYNTSGREENDYYATDPAAAVWIMNLEVPSPKIWECACGEGHLAKVFEEHGFNVKATDLIYRGYGVGGVDFLKETELFDGDIITNPPYKYAQEFVEHALELIPDGRKVCMFLKIQFLEGVKRRALFRRTPPKTVWVSSARIGCGKNGVFNEGRMLCFAWFVWEKGYTGKTTLRWFN